MRTATAGTRGRRPSGDVGPATTGGAVDEATRGRATASPDTEVRVATTTSK